MNIFFGSIFIKKEELEEAGIEYPIKLEYYKIINEDEMIKGKKSKFGIKVVKTEYKRDKTNIEDKIIKYLSSDEQKIDEILTTLKENEVTPICVQDIIYDISKKEIYM